MIRGRFGVSGRARAKREGRLWGGGPVVDGRPSVAVGGARRVRRRSTGVRAPDMGRLAHQPVDGRRCPRQRRGQRLSGGLSCRVPGRCRPRSRRPARPGARWAPVPTVAGSGAGSALTAPGSARPLPLVLCPLSTEATATSSVCDGLPSSPVGRFDGAALRAVLGPADAVTLPAEPIPEPGHEGAFKVAAAAFARWWDGQFPSSHGAWTPQRLAAPFRLGASTAAGPMTLTAAEHRGGRVNVGGGVRQSVKNGRLKIGFEKAVSGDVAGSLEARC